MNYLKKKKKSFAGRAVKAVTRHRQYKTLLVPAAHGASPAQYVDKEAVAPFI